MKQVRVWIWALAAMVLPMMAQAGVTMVSQPQSMTVQEGASVTFAVEATSNRSLRYYWYKDGVMMGNKTKTMTFSSVTEAHEATYTCLVSDGTDKPGRCTPFTLTVAPAGSPPTEPVPCPCICPPEDRTSILKLAWTPPTTRADGTGLLAADIAGYQLFSMASVDPAAPYAKIADIPAQAFWDVEGLTPGEYHYRLKTVDKTGLISSFSAVFSVTVK
jgi:hypothetical protein